MREQILEKLRKHLTAGIEERDVVYLMVEVRKLMDQEPPSDTYPTLRLYANWVVHSELSGDKARAIVRKVDELYLRLVDGNLTEADRQLLKEFSLDHFRFQLNQYLADHDLPVFSDERWREFLLKFLDVIEDCPLKYAGGECVSEIYLLKEMGTIEGEGKPSVNWALCLNGLHKFTIGTASSLNGVVAAAMLDFQRKLKSRE